MKLVEKTNSQTPTYFADVVQLQIKDIVFIDRYVIDYQSLIVGIKPGYQVVILDSTKDGVAQITESLAVGKFQSVHIVSHGRESSLQLGATQLNADNLNFYAEQLQQWANVLTDDADILLYGCDVASKEGTKFVQQISRFTGANVAASTTKTGSAAFGGNWDLDFSTGKIKATLAFQPEVMQAYNSVLAKIINNPSPAANERFGFSLASNGTSILIGAPKANGDRGEVYQLTTNGVLQQTFTNPSNGTGELFGVSVATNGTDYIIGAARFDDQVADVGRAYKFNANGSLQQTFVNSVNNDDSEFGSAVAILSNGNFVIGAPERGKSTATDNAGEVRLFDSSGAIGQIINPTNPTTGFIQDARFGFAVAAANNDILIGSPGFGTFALPIPNFGIGQAYRYNTAGTLLQTFTNPNPSMLDFFGLSVKSNSDGTRFLIGAPGEDSGGTDAGAVYLYDTTTPTPTLLKTFINPDTTNLGFGSSLAFVGNDILIGAAGSFAVNGTTFTPVPGRGAVYLYDGDGASPTYKLETIFSNPGTGNDAFGAAITAVDSNQIAISAPYYDADTNIDAGIVYIYDLNNEPTVNFVIGTNANETFLATTKRDFFDGKDGADRVGANIANLQQNDTINGGAGIDTFILSGGSSADTVTLDLSNPSNQLQGISGLLVSNFENFDLRSFAGTINLIGGTGNDSILGGVGADNLSGGEGNDNLKGGAGNDTLTGGAGNDILDGGIGNDSLVGGEGDDIYYIDSANDIVEEKINGGIDKVYASSNYTLSTDVEHLILTGNAAINGIGNDLNNIIKGNNANNSLLGGEGDNLLYGFGGNDSLTSGAYKDRLYGGDGDDTLTAGAGNDVLDGGIGIDSLVGGDGNDIYYVDSENDIVDENTTDGTDTVYASTTYTLGTNLENLTLTGNSAIAVIGNELNNTIKGNSANNSLDGKEGNNLLYGFGGNDSLKSGLGKDSLYGGDGDDTLIGGAGNDYLVGGAGSDQFLYDLNNFFDSSAFGVDTITDFTLNIDKIVLDKNTFTALSSNIGNGFSISGEFTLVATDAAAATSSAIIVYNSANGRLFYNENGVADGFGSGAQFATLSNRPSLSATDFSIIST